MPVETSNDEVQSSSSAARVDDLLARCHNLLNELEQFQTYLVERKKEHTVELRHFRNSVLSELKSLERVRIPFLLGRYQVLDPLDLTFYSYPKRTLLPTGPSIPFALQIYHSIPLSGRLPNHVLAW